MTKRKKPRSESTRSTSVDADGGEAPVTSSEADAKPDAEPEQGRGTAASAIPPPEELPSTQQLLRSTAIAAAVALVLLLIAVLPAEYGVDPTGIGRVLGLTQMGQVKLELAREAAVEPQANAATPSSAPGRTESTPAKSESERPAATAARTADSAATKSDVTKVTLAPNQSTEIKLGMARGVKATFKWTAEGGVVNYDLHADRPGGIYHGYKKDKAVSSDEGELVAAFDGYHGWFWRNKSSADVTITLETKGDYRDVKKMK